MNEVKTGTRAAVYARLSDEDRNKTNQNDPSESIKNQISLAKKFIHDQGWSITGIYTDDDWSGLDRERPEFNRLLRDCGDGLIDIVVCKDMSRFTRDKIITEEYLETKFLEWRVRFIGLADGSDTADKANKKSREINALVNQWYAEDISHKVRAAFKIKRQQGLFIGSFPPFGYMKSAQSKGLLIVDDEAAETVKRIFCLYLAGNGTQAISRILNQERIPNPTAYKEAKIPTYKNGFKKNSGGFWSKTSVKRILRNEAYIGSMVQHKSEKLHFKTKKRENLPREQWETIKSAHEPIIDEGTFSKVQKMLNSRVRSSGSGTPHLLAGIVVCKDCGSTMVRTSREKYQYLTCSLNRANPQWCSRHSIRLDALVSVIEERIRCLLTEVLSNKDQLIKELLKRENFSSRISLLYSQIEHTSKRLNQNMEALKEVYIDKSQGKIDDSVFATVKEKFILEKICLEQQMGILRTKLSAAVKQEDRAKYWAEALEKFGQFSGLTRDMASLLVNRVEIGERGIGPREIIIYYDFKISH